VRNCGGVPPRPCLRSIGIDDDFAGVVPAGLTGVSLLVLKVAPPCVTAACSNCRAVVRTWTRSASGRGLVEDEPVQPMPSRWVSATCNSGLAVVAERIVLPQVRTPAARPRCAPRPPAWWWRPARCRPDRCPGPQAWPRPRHRSRLCRRLAGLAACRSIFAGLDLVAEDAHAGAVRRVQIDGHGLPFGLVAGAFTGSAGLGCSRPTARNCSAWSVQAPLRCRAGSRPEPPL
jgi:hypothetical protein